MTTQNAASDWQAAWPAADTLRCGSAKDVGIVRPPQQRFRLHDKVIVAHLRLTANSKVFDHLLPPFLDERCGGRPVLVETFVDRARFTGLCFSAANWLRAGASRGRGRLEPKHPAKTLKDIWVFPLAPQARRRIAGRTPAPLTPQPLWLGLAQTDWCAHELDGLDLGDARLDRRVQRILQARWDQPQASFYGSFAGWSPAKSACDFIEHPEAPPQPCQPAGTSHRGEPPLPTTRKAGLALANGLLFWMYTTKSFQLPIRLPTALMANPSGVGMATLSVPVMAPPVLGHVVGREISG